MQRSRRVAFCFEVGTSITFFCNRASQAIGRIEKRASHITRRVQRARSSALAIAPKPRRDIQPYPVRRYKRKLGKESMAKKAKVKATAVQPGKADRKVATAPPAPVGTDMTKDKPVYKKAPSDLNMCTRFFGWLLLHVNLLLAICTGVVLATWVRLKYDPSTYMIVRELLPTQHEQAVKMLPMVAAGLQGLLHFAVLALGMRRWCRRLLLLLYAVVMGAIATVEAMVVRDLMAEMRETMKEGQAHVQTLINHTKSVMSVIATWHHFTHKFQMILEELEKDILAPMDVAEKAGICLFGLQVSAVVLALLTAATTPVRRAPRYQVA